MEKQRYARGLSALNPLEAEMLASYIKSRAECLVWLDPGNMTSEVAGAEVDGFLADVTEYCETLKKLR